MSSLEKLKSLCARPVFQAGTAPLKKGVEMAVHIDGGQAVTLARTDEGAVVLERIPASPDLTLLLPSSAIETLSQTATEDVGELGVEILKLMSHAERDKKIHVKVHIGLLEFVFHGYLGILPLGGPTVMKFLASKGFTSIGKIREAIANLRSQR